MIPSPVQPIADASPGKGAPARWRWVFRAGVLGLWLLVGVLGLELFAGAAAWRAAHFNRFVRAYQALKNWPHFDLDDRGNAMVHPIEVPSASQEEKARFIQSRAEDHLGALFSQLDKGDRAMLARLRQQIMAVCDREGRVIEPYGDELTAARIGAHLADFAAGTVIAPAGNHIDGLLAKNRRAYDEGRPQAIAFDIVTPWQRFLVEMRSYPLKNPTGATTAVLNVFASIGNLTVTEAMAQQQDIEANPQWVVPWQEYRKNNHLAKDWWTNNVGFWDDDVILPRPAGVFRIVCVGGSTTDEGFTKEECYVDNLERLLNHQFNGKPVIDAVNCGVSGIDSIGECSRTLDYIRIEPNLIIEYNAVNDICHWLLPDWADLATRAQRIMQRSHFIERYFNHLLWPNDNEIRNRLRDTVIRNKRIMAEAAREKKITIAFCSFTHPDVPNLTQEEADYYNWDIHHFWQGRYFNFATYCRVIDLYNEEIKSLCAEMGALYIPLGEEFKGGSRYFGDICHTRPLGMKRKAEIIGRHVAAYLTEHIANTNSAQQ